MRTIEYLKERLLVALKEVAIIEKKIKEEKRRTEVFDIRVVVETKGFGEWDWRRTVLSHHMLTLEQRENLIRSLRWLEK